ncbi:MAG TPA: EAL domain-containing response regulator [Polyangiaceae bacterium]|nr:EAL domain-containing response regulator [Polyangiaceae bacterium]
MATGRSSLADDTGKGVVVLVDDDPLALRALERSLRPNHEVMAYRSADEAIEHVAIGGVSVVLSDISMPGMTGIELLRAIRRYDTDLPVILITGVPTLESATKAIEYGVFRYLSKPFDREELCQCVRHASQLYRLAKMKREALELVGPPGASDRVGLDVSFRRALETLWVAFQPIISASTRTVFGYEALMRSSDPVLPGPTHLLDAAERLGALEELGQLIRRRAVEPIARAPAGALLFVNLHPRDLMDPELLQPDAPLTSVAHRVVLEITERASLGGLDNVQERVAALRALGFRIAIDDLGAGYAGLTSFALLEPDIVKIDMSLTRDIDRSAVKQKLVSSLTALCREMNLIIVTEGVETTAERDTLTALGCDLLQGYLFARPGPAFPDPLF